MIGAALSRWTMAYFCSALLFLLGAELLMAGGYGFPSADVGAPETLIVVHMVTIGWLSLLMCGALFQFVPVLVAKPLRGKGLVLPALVCLLAGLASLIAGFLQLSGVPVFDLPLLPLASMLLPAGFVLAVVVLALTLWSARPARVPLPARFVAVGLASLLATFTLGGLFALFLSGHATALMFVDLRAYALPAHVAAGLGGWIGLTSIGVSYRLLPMFMLAPDKERRTGHAAWWIGVAALSLAVPGMLLEGLIDGPGRAGALAALLGAAAVALYGADLLFFYRNRKRRAIELNSMAALGAFAALFLSALLLLALLATGTLQRHAGALVYLAVFGWLTGLGLSQLYKIVPFLTWLECYGPIMGKKPTPRVQDLVVERRGRLWFALYFLGVLAGVGALLAERPELFRMAAAATLVATLAIAVELVLSRRLLNLAAGARLPEGVSPPRLFLASSH